MTGTGPAASLSSETLPYFQPSVSNHFTCCILGLCKHSMLAPQKALYHHKTHHLAKAFFLNTVFESFKILSYV